MTNTIAAAMSKIMNAERAKKLDVEIYPISKTVETIIKILNELGYIAGFKKNKNSFIVMLNGSINKCGAILPNYSIKADEYEAFEKRYLPAKDFGVLILTTPEGVMTHLQAKEKGIGGRLIAYCY